MDTAPAQPDQASAAAGFNFWARHSGLALPVSAVLLALGLASVPYPLGLRISGRAVTSAVTLVLVEDSTASFDTMALEPPNAIITGAAAIELPADFGPMPAARPAGPIGATLEADTLLLSNISLDAGMRLTMQRSSVDRLSLLAQGANGTLELEARGATEIRPDRGPAIHAALDTPAVVGIRIDRASGVPTGLQASTKDALAFENLPVSQITFTRPVSVGGRGSPFVSAIVSGNVQLVDTARTETLDAGSALLLDGFNGWVVRLETMKDAFSLSFTGTTKRLSLGPLGHPMDARPSILEFLFHQQWLTMIWVSAFAGLAAVAKIRSWAIGKLDD